jgi:hypothetical protein
MIRKARILVAIASLMLVPASATAWVAVGGPRFFGAAAVGVAAGVVVGSAVAASQPQTVVVQAPPAPPAVGTVVSTLPSGCVSTGTRYQCGPIFYQPYFGGNGVYYQVVAP